MMSERMQKPQRRQGILAEVFPDEAILYHAEAGTLHVLNATAAAIWQMCDGQHEVSAIAECLRSQYAMRPEHAVERDVGRMLDELQGLGLLEPVVCHRDSMV